MTAQLTWGAKVRVVLSAPTKLRPGELGWVCGLDTMDSESKAERRGYSLGATVYTVEFEDGSSLEMEGRFLELG